MIRRTFAPGGSELAWFKSSYSSNGNEGDCVEVAVTPDSVLVRDSKNAQAARLTFGEAAWAGFVPYAAKH